MPFCTEGTGYGENLLQLLGWPLFLSNFFAFARPAVPVSVLHAFPPILRKSW